MRRPTAAVWNLTLTTAVYLQVAMLLAALGLTQAPWYPVARGFGPKPVAAGHFGYQALVWLPSLGLDLLLALNYGRVKLTEGMGLACAGAGLLVFAAGTALGFWAWLALGRLRGRPVTVVEGQALLTHGPFGLVRHPAYFGNILQFLGAGLALQNWILVVGALAAFAFWKRVADDEDDLLLAHFGDPFKKYRRRVPQLIPFTGV